jgi:uncharacterized protein (TIGR02246 family)
MVKQSDRSKDEATILSIEEAYDRAWNRGDAKALVSSFAPDAIIINPRGEVVVGKAEFKKVTTTLLSGPFKGSVHTTKVIRIHFPKEDIAVVDGEATLTWLKEPEESTTLTNVNFTDVMVRESDRWLIADVRAYIVPPSPKEQPSQ